MDSSVTLGGASFSTLDNTALRANQVEYVWVPKSSYEDCKITGYENLNGVWAKQEGSGRNVTYTVPTGDAAILKAGTGIQLVVNGTGKALNLSGEVSDAQIVLTTVNNFNFIGYPFPTDGSVLDVQMDETVTLGGASFSTLDNTALRANIVEYVWIPESSYADCKVTGREGDNGVWAKQEGSGRNVTYTVPTGDAAILKAGSAIQLVVNGTGKKVYINPTYTLSK